MSPLLPRLASLTRSQKIALMVALDAICLPGLFYMAICLRNGAVSPPASTDVLFGGFTAVACVAALGQSGLYLSVVRYLDSRIIMRAATGLLVVVVLAHATAVLLSLDFRLAALWIFGSLAFSYVAITRFFARTVLRRRAASRSGMRPDLTVIYGAGLAGAHLAQSMLQSRAYVPLFFVDDDPALQGKLVAGLRVHSVEDLETSARTERIDMLVVALPTVSARRRQEILDRLEALSIPTRVLPGIRELVGGKVTLSALRDVELTDLLGREPVPPRADLFTRNILDRGVLVTGAGGSIGTELCRQVASQQPRVLVLVDHSEFALYEIDRELRQNFPVLSIVSVLGSVVDGDLLSMLLAHHAIDTVYHAAAYKHVPLVEFNVLQGITNNVFGSLAVARAAAAAGVQACILVSTDKAVRPTNVMGATKRIAEQIFQALAATTTTRFSIVRFGNVLGSSGSVVPLFRQQIRSGGPLTLTHRDITRFFMLIPEAAQLVIQAGAMADGGEVFVLDMGEPIRIIDLARKMIHLSGLTERADGQEGDIEIEIVGLRPGEKLFEELLLGDDVSPSDHPRIWRAAETFLRWEPLSASLERLREAGLGRRHDEAMAILRELVPEYRPREEEDGVATSSATPLRTAHEAKAVVLAGEGARQADPARVP